MPEIDLEKLYQLTLEQQKALEKQDVQKLVDVTNKKQEIIDACIKGIYVLSNGDRQNELLKKMLELEKANLVEAKRLKQRIMDEIARIKRGRNAIKGYFAQGHIFSAYIDKKE